jgi:hypothetical protein
MLTRFSEAVEGCRVVAGPLASSEADGRNGLFIMPGPLGRGLRCIVSDGGGWEHLSVSLELPEADQVCPVWEEMAWAARCFWGPEETVIQFHPPQSRHVNYHSATLHCWRSQSFAFPQPPGWMVGLLPSGDLPPSHAGDLGRIGGALEPAGQSRLADVPPGMFVEHCGTLYLVGDQVTATGERLAVAVGSGDLFRARGSSARSVNQAIVQVYRARFQPGGRDGPDVDGIDRKGPNEIQTPAGRRAADGGSGSVCSASPDDSDRGSPGGQGQAAPGGPGRTD